MDEEGDQGDPELYGVPLAYDILTGLVSAEVFDAQLERALRRGWRTPNSVVVLLLGVDGLEAVARRAGRAIADEALAGAAARLRTCVRDVDTVARLDPGVLAVLLESDRREDRSELMAAEVASRLVSAFAEPLATTGGEFAVDAHIGIAAAEPSTLDSAELLQSARQALARAARGDGSAFTFHDAGQQEEAVRRLRLKDALGQALARDELSLRYQPMVALQTGVLVGVEALLRWDAPGIGAVSPSEFIPLAEESNLIVGLGEWVLRTALVQRAAWSRAIPGLPSVGVSVNVSPRQLARPGLVAGVRSMLADTGLSPEVLLVELDERTLMLDDEVSRAQVAGLRELGVRLALDDFGTGWTSLEHLSRVPVDVLKIAPVFIDQVGQSSRANAMVRAIVDLAHSLGLVTVAEGVERPEQAGRLKDMGCVLGQGWHFAHELAVSDATVALRLLVPEDGGAGSPPAE